MAARQIAAHRVRPADRAQQRVVGGIVALRHRAAHQVGIGGGPAARSHHRRARLVEQGQILLRDGGRIRQADLAAIDRVEEGHRHPQLRHALLREQGIAIIGDGPVRPDPAHRDADLAPEALAQILDHADECGRGLLALVYILERGGGIGDLLNRPCVGRGLHRLARRIIRSRAAGLGTRLGWRADAGGQGNHRKHKARRDTPAIIRTHH